jgi:hypothetical protein
MSQREAQLRRHRSNLILVAPVARPRPPLQSPVLVQS